MLTLICYVRDDNCKQAFEVEIDKAKSVSALREAIKEKTRPKFDDISADSLSLWKASVPINRDLKKCVETLNLVDDDSLYSYEILSDIFSSGLEGKSVHIIIDRHHSGELQLPMSLFNNAFFPNIVSHQVAFRHCPLPVSLDHTKGRYSNAIKYPYSLIYSSVAIRSQSLPTAAPVSLLIFLSTLFAQPHMENI